MDKEIRKAKQHVRDRQKAFWDNVAETGKAAKQGEAQTATSEDDEKKAQRQSV